MIEYTGVKKCHCGLRARYVARDGMKLFHACILHSAMLKGKHKPENRGGTKVTDADIESWEQS